MPDGSFVAVDREKYQRPDRSFLGVRDNEREG
jgi:hypothetical protein